MHTLEEEKQLQLNNLSFHLRKIAKEKYLSWKQAEEKEKKIFRAETNETENRKIKSTKGWLFRDQ